MATALKQSTAAAGVQFSGFAVLKLSGCQEPQDVQRNAFGGFVWIILPLQHNNFSPLLFASVSTICPSKRLIVVKL